MKFCKDCEELKSLDFFYKNKKLYLGVSHICKSCSSIRSKNYHIANRDKRNKNRKVRAESPKGKLIDFIWRLKTKYNMTLDDYNNMVINQNSVCKICKNTCMVFSRLSVDHCHETGKVRGLLCDNCNKALGYFKDNKNLLNSAIEYLNEYP